jgi:precorrin-3B synthase
VPAAVRSRADACPGVFAPHDAADGALARIRLPGGVISATALRAVADCADDLGDGHLHLTSRGNLQLRGLSRSSALPARLAEAGLLPSTTHERVRNVLASPLAGIAHDPRAREGMAASTTVGARGPGSPAGASDEDPPLRVGSAAAAAVGTRGRGSPDVRAMAVALDRGLCARPGLAALPGRFLFALDDGRGDVAAEGPDLCWQTPGRLLVAGVPVAEVASGDAVAVLLDAAEAFLALRAADGGRAWRAAELADGPARIVAELADGPARIVAELADEPARIAKAPTHRSAVQASRSCGPAPEAVPGLQQGGPAPIRLQQSHLAAIPRADAAPVAAVPGLVRRDDGGVALIVAPLLGELTAAQARLLAGTGPTAVVTPWRTVVLPDPTVSAADLAAAGLIVEPGPAADVSACAGRPGCTKALADVRADALAAIGHLPSGRIHVSGCERRCGAPRGPHIDAVALAGGRYVVDGAMRTGLG